MTRKKSDSDDSAQLSSLHKTQLQLAQKRQPTVCTKTETILDRALIDNDHPFELSESDYLSLMNLPAYQSCCGSEIDASGSKYLYRLIPTSSIRHSVTGLRDPVHTHVQDSDGFAQMLADRFGSGQAPGLRGHWPELNDLAAGEYANPRGMSWWSTHSPPSLSDPKPILESALQTGICYDGIPRHGILLRLCLTRACSIPLYMPTYHEAYDLPVYLPLDEDPAGFGQTIDLRGHEPALGNDEILAGPVPVSCISFFPFTIPEDLRRSYRHLSLKELTPGLEKFYRMSANA